MKSSLKYVKYWGFWLNYKNLLTCKYFFIYTCIFFFFVYFCANVFNYYNFLSSFFNRLYSEESMDLWTLTATGINTRMNLDMRIMNIGWVIYHVLNFENQEIYTDCRFAVLKVFFSLCTLVLLIRTLTLSLDEI